MKVDEYLSKFCKETKDPSLKAMKYFMNEFNHPEEKLKIIHVGGTNGKGSCVEMISKILINGGYKVGKFMSPHLIKYNERISIQNKNITNKKRKELINIIKPKAEKYNNENETKITFFELETTMALLYFCQEKCDFVVLEVGLGGTYDCTNIVNPLISIITSIGYDHMNILGSDILEIAQNKFGIIKQNSKTIYATSENETINEMIKNKCFELNNELHIVSNNEIKNYSYNEKYQKFDYLNFKDILINLKGKKQIYNAALVLECIEILNKLNYNIDEKTVRNSLKKIVHKARFEKIYNNPTIIYEGGHNEDAINNYINSLDMYYKNNEKVYIIQLLKTKDYQKVLSRLTKYDSKGVFVFTDGNNKELYWPKETLSKYALNINKNLEIYTMDLSEAIKTIKEIYNDKVIFILGTFYIYGDIYKMLRNKK